MVQLQNCESVFYLKRSKNCCANLTQQKRFSDYGKLSPITSAESQVSIIRQTVQTTKDSEVAFHSDPILSAVGYWKTVPQILSEKSLCGLAGKLHRKPLASFKIHKSVVIGYFCWFLILAFQRFIST